MKPAVRRQFPKSARLYEEASRYEPGGVSSNFRLKMHPFPLFFDRGAGSKLYDVDGQEYVDYALGMGPVILGHAHPDVTAAVAACLGRGQLFAGQHEEEIRLARRIAELMPAAEMVRFGSSGSEAIQAALRVARAYTGRVVLAKFEGHYHGWFDNVFVSVHPRSEEWGLPAQPAAVPMSVGQDTAVCASVRILPWNDLESVRQFFEREGHEIAALIMEPILCNTSVIVPTFEFLRAVQDLCIRHGALLIFDEVITGFRVSSGGAQEWLGVRPDLSVFAKALANGFPISCVAGRADVMRLMDQGGAMHGGTYNSNLPSCVAALATLDVLSRDDGAAYRQIENMGRRLMQGLADVARAHGCPLLIQGMPAVFHTTITDQSEIRDYRSYCRCRVDLQARLVGLLLEYGVRITGRGTWFLSAAHTESDVQTTLEAADGAIAELSAKAGW